MIRLDNVPSLFSLFCNAINAIFVYLPHFPRNPYKKSGLFLFGRDPSKCQTTLPQRNVYARAALEYFRADNHCLKGVYRYRRESQYLHASVPRILRWESYCR